MAHGRCLRLHDRSNVVNEYDIPPTAAELAAEGDAFVQWERAVPQPEPRKRKKSLDTRQFTIDEQIAAAIEAHKVYMDAVLVGVIAELQHRFKQQFEQIQTEVANLRTALEVERQVNLRMGMVAQEQQRHYPRAANGHA